jgi:hypothetical protein
MPEPGPSRSTRPSVDQRTRRLAGPHNKSLPVVLRPGLPPPGRQRSSPPGRQEARPLRLGFAIAAQPVILATKRAGRRTFRMALPRAQPVDKAEGAERRIWRSPEQRTARTYCLHVRGSGGGARASLGLVAPCDGRPQSADASAPFPSPSPALLSRAQPLAPGPGAVSVLG